MSQVLSLINMVELRVRASPMLAVHWKWSNHSLHTLYILVSTTADTEIETTDLSQKLFCDHLLLVKQ